MLLILLASLLAVFGVYIFMPGRGMLGFIRATLTVSGFMSILYLIKLIIVA